MSWRPLFLCSLIVFLPGAGQQQPSSQHGPVKLAWKFKEKDRFTLESNVSQTQLRRGGGRIHKDVVQVRVLSSFAVSKVNEEDKTVELEQKIDDARYDFDGTDRLSAALQADLFAKLKGASFQITLTESGKVQKLEGYDALIKRIKEASPADAERFKAMVTEESLKNATEDGFACFPPEAVKHGETWKRPVTIPVPPAGVLKGDLTYTLRGVTKGKAKVTSKCESSEFQASGNLMPGLKSEFTVDGRESTLHFDIEKGRLATSETVCRFRGKITSAADQGSLPLTILDIEMLQNVKITVRDKSR